MTLPRPRTVRAKLTLTTSMVVALVLFALGFLVAVGTERALTKTVNDDLRRRGHDFAQNQLNRPDRGPGGPGGPPRELLDLLTGGPRQGGADGGPFGRRPNGADNSRPRVIDLPENDRPHRGPRETAYDYDAIGTLKAHPETSVLFTTVTSKGEPLRVYSETIRRDGRLVSVVQVAYPLVDVNGAMEQLRRLLLTVAVPLGTLLAAAASLFIVDRLMRPLRVITENARTMDAGNFEGRLPVVGDDEFAGLAVTLNGMLGRLEEAFRLEQATTRRLADTIDQQRRFTADASHELKTPLATIKAHAGLLVGVGDEDDQESIGAIGDAANRMRGLVDDLLVLARADGGSLTARTAPVDLAETVSAAIGAVSPMPVEVRGAARPLVVQGNGEALTRLFINLLDNAKKYAGGAVEVRLARRGSDAEIAVVDQGVGIAPEHLPKLFDRFYRPDTSRTSETGGTGLGLAICKEIAAAHGGTIEVASRVGGGTAFTVVLPLAA